MDFKETEGQFAILAESLPQLVWSARSDGYNDYFNQRWHEFTGLNYEKSAGDRWKSAIHPDDLPPAEVIWAQAIATQRPYEVEYRLRKASGEYVWVLVRGNPVCDTGGKVVRWFGTATDIERQKQAEEALRSLEKQYRLALEASRLGTWKIDLDRGVVSWDEGTCSLFNIPHNGLYSLPLDEAMARIHEDDRALVAQRMAMATARGSNGRYEVEYRTVTPEGEIRWIRSNGRAYHVRDGNELRAAGLSGVISDITEQHAAEQAKQLLTRELTHRVKNLFAIANGMVSMTARTAKDPKEMANLLRGRLSALSRAHELVRPIADPVRRSDSDIDLEQLIKAVLAPYREADGDQVAIEGPALEVGPNTTTSLALVLHELATNAAKYGCLSRAKGLLSIGWTMGADGIDLVWTETGGPPIPHPPTFEGFGTQLALRSITGQLGGTLDREWRREGLRVHMALPLSRLRG
ncbi:PAS domain-containing protein [Microvirga alba]|uniref:Blue-light-activated histidine kinase n=1 Tax=Microvirga alba TaxID=2791025 RepID=A0A931FPL2_9HYPH|nr:PAS domain-containing protein [Microvirga alba]MBF9234890.1 PAS domain-containing protein [Microvirga alba]